MSSRLTGRLPERRSRRRAAPGLRTSGGLRDDLRLMARGWRWSRRPLVPRSAEPWVEPLEQRPFPTAWARTRIASAARDGMQRFGLSPLLRFEVEPVVSGLDVLDGLRPPALFVANHASHLDTALLLCTLPPQWPRRTTFAAAADYFFDVWWRAVGSALVFNTFPIDRFQHTGTSAPSQLLEEGWNVVVYPEGGRSPDGWMQPFRAGAAWLSVTHGVPIVPVRVRGSYAAMPRGRGWPVPGRPPVYVRYGAPLWPDAEEPVRSFAGRVERTIARLLEEDETTWWESLRRRAEAVEPPATQPPAAPWRRIWEAFASPPTRRRERVWRR